MEDLLTQLTSLAGLGALIAALLGIFKHLGWAKDGTSQNWSTGLNLIALIGLYVAKVYSFDLGGADNLAASLAVILPAVVKLFTMLLGSKAGYAALKGVPLVGKTYS